MTRACLLGAAAVLLINLGLCGCKQERKESLSPATQPEAAANISQQPVKVDPAAGDELAVLKERIDAVKKERDAAVKKASQADGESKYYQAELEDERKNSAAIEQKLKSLQATVLALRLRLWDAGETDWVSRTEAEAFDARTDVTITEDAGATGGKAVLFDKKSGAIETLITVKPGTYSVVPIGRAPNGGDHDALDLSVVAVDKATGDIDVQKRIFFDAEKQAFVGASGSPNIAVIEEGKLKVSLKVGEETGMIVDRIELRVFVPK